MKNDLFCAQLATSFEVIDIEFSNL